MLKATKVNWARDGVIANPMLSIRRCRHGTMMYLRNDVYIGRSLDDYGEYSEPEVELFRQFLGKGDVALDVGANIGAHTIPLAHLVGPGGLVYAFEPQRILFQILCGNVALNELSNVEALQKGVGRSAGQAKIAALNYGAPNNFGGLSIGGDRGEKVEIIAIDELELSKVRLIKIDIEGMELDALLGAKRTIERCRPILYVENDRPEQSTELVGQLQECRYRLWWHVVPFFNRTNFLANPNNAFGTSGSFNMLGVPKEMTAPHLQLQEILSPHAATAALAQARSTKPVAHSGA
jgi:FkbM family methyltransferase